MQTSATLTDSFRRRPILGVQLALTDYAEVLDVVRNAVSSNCQIRLNFCNVHVVMAAQESTALLSALNYQNALALPDGMPLVWALRSLGEHIADRVYGPHFFELCLRETAATGMRHFFYGGSPETLSRLLHKAAQQFPELCIAGSFSPPFGPTSDADKLDTLRMINDSRADIVWVSLGAPKQELWIDSVASRISAHVLAGVGAAFDFYAGTVNQAPEWMQKCGLEWFFRLLQEPGRLWFRYSYYNPLFVAKFIKERLFHKKR